MCIDWVLGTSSQNIPYLLGASCWSVSPIQPIETSDPSHHLQGLGITGQRPEEPNLAIIDRRRATYLTYPHGSVSLDIERLCQAGYYYAGQF